MTRASAWPKVWQRLLLLALSAVSAWSAWRTYQVHLFPAILNGVAAVVLLLLALYRGPET